MFFKRRVMEIYTGSAEVYLKATHLRTNLSALGLKFAHLHIN